MRTRQGWLAGLLALPVGAGVALLQLRGWLTVDSALFAWVFWLCAALLLWLLALAAPPAPGGRGSSTAPPPGAIDNRAAGDTLFPASRQTGAFGPAARQENACFKPLDGWGSENWATDARSTGDRMADGRAAGGHTMATRCQNCRCPHCPCPQRRGQNGAQNFAPHRDIAQAPQNAPCPADDPLRGLGGCLVGGCGLCLLGALGGQGLRLGPLAAALWLGGLAAAFFWLLLCLLALACAWAQRD